MKLQDKVKKAKELEYRFKEEYLNENYEDGTKIEKEYLVLRKEIIEEIDTTIDRYKSLPLSIIRKRVASTPKPRPIETGVRPLDRELTNVKGYARGDIGGFPLGNLIQLSGAKGAGKTSLLLKILSNFSIHGKVSWFNFEMSDRQVTEKIECFKANEDNVMYYAASRDLDDIINEIKYLSADNIKHFVIDSNMKITVKNANRFETDSMISSKLKELTSVLDINIYLINQISQQSEKEGGLFLKGGNNAEYDSDMILFILKPKIKGGDGKEQVDETGNVIYDEDVRYIKCTKNRIYDNRLFLVKINKTDLYGVEIAHEAEYQPNTKFDNVEFTGI